METLADVPLGAFLSGGVDSSGVVSMMAQATRLPVVTCSISFGDPAFDKSPYARKLAARYGLAITRSASALMRRRSSTVWPRCMASLSPTARHCRPTS